MSRRLLIAGNWKMNGTVASANQLIRELIAKDIQALQCEMLVCPSFVFLASFHGQTKDQIALGAQDCSRFEEGAYTGEVSAAMIRSVGADYCIVGHSERRQYHGESSHDVAEKARQVLRNGMTPIICVGETLEQRNADQIDQVVNEQLNALLPLLSAELSKIVIAYEPVWAIGTGLTATPEQAQSVHAMIRSWLLEQSAEAAEKVRILYGGSVNAENAALLFAQEDIDGGLVGGASLDAESFFAIGQAAG